MSDGLFRLLLRRIGWKGVAKRAVDAAGDALYKKADELREEVSTGIDDRRRAREEAVEAERRAREAAAEADRRARAEAAEARALEDELEALKARVERGED